MGEEKAVLDFSPIKGKRDPETEELLTLLFGEPYKNPTLERIAIRLSQRIDEVRDDPELNEAMKVYSHMENLWLTALKEFGNDIKGAYKKLAIKFEKYLKAGLGQVFLLKRLI